MKLHVLSVSSGLFSHHSMKENSSYQQSALRKSGYSVFGILLIVILLRVTSDSCPSWVQEGRGRMGRDEVEPGSHTFPKPSLLRMSSLPILSAPKISRDDPVIALSTFFW